MTDHEPLSPQQVEQFLTTGLVVVERAFDPAQQPPGWVERGWQRLGVDPDDPGTWTQPRVHLPTEQRVDAAELAPRAHAAALQLLGYTPDDERVDLPWHWGDGFIANLGVGADRPFAPPSPDVPGWHKDGDFFRHFLDSPEQGLLTIVLWTDVVSTGGGTFVATDSVGVVARHLADHPEGLLPVELQETPLISRCREFTEVTGRAGDVVLMHPFTLHATSQNVLRAQRLITNPPIALRQPMRFDRTGDGSAGEAHSPVEQAVLRGLGTDSHAFSPSRPREAVVPERLRRAS